MLDAYIIDEIKKRDEARREENRPRLQIEIDPRRRERPRKEEHPDHPEERDEEEPESGEEEPVSIRLL